MIRRLVDLQCFVAARSVQRTPSTGPPHGCGGGGDEPDEGYSGAVLTANTPPKQQPFVSEPFDFVGAQTANSKGVSPTAPQGLPDA
jgi:hypothetical protein